jgi:hypothetical protein
MCKLFSLYLILWSFFLAMCIFGGRSQAEVQSPAVSKRRESVAFINMVVKYCHYELKLQVFQPEASWFQSRNVATSLHLVSSSQRSFVKLFLGLGARAQGKMLFWNC